MMKILFPLLRNTISALVGDAITVVDSAVTTAAVVQQIMQSQNGLNQSQSLGELQLLATDGITRFARVGGRFLGESLTAKDVLLVDL